MVPVGNCGPGCHNFTGSVIRSEVSSHFVLQVICLGLKNTAALRVKSRRSSSFVPEVPLNKTEEESSKSHPSRGSGRTPCCSTEEEDKSDPQAFASGLEKSSRP